MDHLCLLRYTGHENEQIKGCLLYEDYKLTKAFLHPTFVTEYWTDIKASFFMATGNMNAKGTLKTIKEAELIEVNLDKVSEEFQKIGSVKF